MKEYARILFPLFMPLTGLFMVFASLYFGRENGFSEALKLGVLTGFLLAVVITPFIALFLFFIHRIKNPKPKKEQKQSSKNKLSAPIKEKVSSKPSTTQEEELFLSEEEKLILLMDKNLTTNVTLAAISEQNIGTATQKQDGENLILSLDTDRGDITLTLTPLTKHTTELTIASSYNPDDAKKIIRYIKEKEFSFLNY